MTPQLVSCAGLLIALSLYAVNWSYTGLLYIFAHVMLVGVAAFVSRPLGDGENDGVISAVNTLALALPLACFTGAALSRVSVSDEEPRLPGGYLGSSPDDVVSELLHGWWIWLPLLTVAAIALGRRRASLFRLGPLHAAATCTAVLSAPVLLIPGLASVAREFMNGGAETLVVYPLVMAALFTAWAWLRGSSPRSGRGLRKCVPPFALGGISVATVLTWLARSPGSSLARAYAQAGSHGTWAFGWRVVSLQHLGGVLAVVSVALLYARDPGEAGATCGVRS